MVQHHLDILQRRPAKRRSAATLVLLILCCTTTAVGAFLLVTTRPTAHGWDTTMRSSYNHNLHHRHRPSSASPARTSFLRDSSTPQKDDSHQQDKHSHNNNPPALLLLDAEEDRLPANLRRKVQAQRPTLGHVVPRESRRRQQRQPQQSQDGGGSSDPLLRPQGQRRDAEAGLNNPSLLRISAGSAKGRRLESPTVYLRPMMGKVREAVFSTLTSFGLYGTATATATTTRHLDIFAGSGSVGLESLSRGAAHCTFVDLSPDCCSTIRRNLEKCQFVAADMNDDHRATVVCADALQVLRHPAAVGLGQSSSGVKNGSSNGKEASQHHPYHLVTLCPPYEEVVYGDLLEAVAGSELVGEDTVVLVEYPVELGSLPHVFQGRDNGGRVMVGVRNRRYGRTVIAMYVVNPSGRLEVAASRPEEFVTV